MERGAALRERLTRGAPLLLDGALGTELERRGVATPAPAWSAAALATAPDQVLAVHRDFVRAGADLLTTNTFRTLARALPGAPPGEAERLLELAVHLARQAAGEAPADRAGPGGPAPVLVLGSMGPLEDCFRPDRVPTEPALGREHATRAAALLAAGVDGLLVETMNTRREALAALAAGRATGLPVLVACVAADPERLLDGDRLDAVVPALAEAGADAILVNCTPLAMTARVVPGLARLVGDLPFGAYANNGYGSPARGSRTRGAPAPVADSPAAPPSAAVSAAVSPAAYARQAAGWLAAGARLIGGCCGTTPAHIAALRALLDDHSS
jgi:S-methylmethionine-dependent homocysteine/selenocysteine methylase